MRRKNHIHKYHQFREKHPEFNYHSFNYEFLEDTLSLEFHFSIGDVYFFKPKHKIQLSKKLRWQEIEKKELDQLVFHLGMVELISYWKSSCSPKVIIKPFKLNKSQIQWWKKLYYEGLGEFFYLNTIDTSMNDFMQIVCESEQEVEAFNNKVSNDFIMVPIGGGKDSVVSLELLKNATETLIPMVVNPRGATIDTIVNSGFNKEDAIFTNRIIDKQLLELNKQGYLNGHTPFSAMLAFLTLLTSRLMGIKYIALSNESSANESTVTGTNINHQYSKSYEFENDFRDYYQYYLSKNQEYFSFLRPLTELQIACLFSQFSKHHYSFRSCNAGSKENIWCGKCPKCLFTYVLLSPFISQEKMAKIFDKKLLNDKNLKPIFEELRGLAETKPFECVGTVSEVNLSLANAKPDYYKELLMADIENESDNEEWKSALNEWNAEHFLPSDLEKLLKKNIERC